jgi:hypothetical protein
MIMVSMVAVVSIFVFMAPMAIPPMFMASMIVVVPMVIPSMFMAFMMIVAPLIVGVVWFCAYCCSCNGH